MDGRSFATGYDQLAPFLAPTNTGLGVYFHTAGMTNMTSFSTSPNFSIWVVLASASRSPRKRFMAELAPLMEYLRLEIRIFN